MMATRQLGVSVKSISEPVSLEAIELLGRSAIQTFETSHEIFQTPCGSELKQQFLNMLRETGKTAPTYHIPYGPAYDPSQPDGPAREKTFEKVVRLLDEAIELTACRVIMHGSWEPVKQENRSEQKKATRRFLERIESELSARGLQMAVEILPRSCLGNRASELLEILDGLNPRVFGVCLDVNHLMDRYASLPDEVRMIGKKLISLHISEYDGIDERHWLPKAPGGVIDWSGFMNALQEVSYAGVFNYELRTTSLPESVQGRIAAIEENWKKYFQEYSSFKFGYYA